MQRNEDTTQRSDSSEWRLWQGLIHQAASNDQLRSELERIKSSSSWRWTAPLRRLRAMFSSATKEDGGLLSASHSTLQQIPLRQSCNTQLLRYPGEGTSLYVDVTELARHDQAAGVERVTRRLLWELLHAPPDGWAVMPVRLSSEGRYCHAREFLASFLGESIGAYGMDSPIEARRGERFVGLDFCRQHHELLGPALSGMRQAGVIIELIVHDLLPLTHPHWFPSRVSEDFEAWLSVLSSNAHKAWCISKATADTLQSELESRGLPMPTAGWRLLPLGADLLPMPDAEVLPPASSGVVRFLTVGTIEPRKGYAQILDAFEALWARGEAVEWVLVGRPGWMVADLISRLEVHPLKGARFHWKPDADDRMLGALYRRCDVLLNASEGEGFGLPIVEAGLLGLPLLLRDLPVFREVAGARAKYFKASDAFELAHAMQECVSILPGASKDPASWMSWAGSAAILGAEPVSIKGAGV